MVVAIINVFFFFQAEDGIRDIGVTGVQTCALPIWSKTLACAHAPCTGSSPSRCWPPAAADDAGGPHREGEEPKPMMHGREKSDPAIVAVKPTNKAEQSAAEPVEPRAGAKGNAGEHSTGRTQSRETVTQGLERIRQAARQEKKERFTALLHHVSTAHLEAAFYELKENAAPGVDGLTWRDYEADLERKLVDLHARVHRGAYRPLPSRRVYIPKPDGRERPLAGAGPGSKIEP